MIEQDETQAKNLSLVLPLAALRITKREEKINSRQHWRLEVPLKTAGNTGVAVQGFGLFCFNVFVAYI